MRKIENGVVVTTHRRIYILARKGRRVYRTTFLSLVGFKSTNVF
tara:strand:+ start:509 stop:640 length:132 start_codon:yes stop_codon:yes gene_type:complete